MKFTKCLLTVFAALAGTVLVMDLPIHAQSLALQVNIPFEFHAGEKTLPAGTYTVQKRGDAIVIGDRNGNTSAVICNPIDNKAYKLHQDLVVFHRYGDERFLSEVRWSGYSTARGLVPTSAERQIAKVLPAETVKLAAMSRYASPPSVPDLLIGPPTPENARPAVAGRFFLPIGFLG